MVAILRRYYRSQLSVAIIGRNYQPIIRPIIRPIMATDKTTNNTTENATDNTTANTTDNATAKNDRYKTSNDSMMTIETDSEAKQK